MGDLVNGEFGKNSISDINATLAFSMGVEVLEQMKFGEIPAFFRFMAEQYEEVLEENPELADQPAGKVLNDLMNEALNDIQE